MNHYIHELPDWPDFYRDHKKLSGLLGSVRHRQGHLIGKMEALGFPLQAEATLQTLTLDVLKSSEIEGEILDRDQIRSSIARRLGLDIGALGKERIHFEAPAANRLKKETDMFLTWFNSKAGEDAVLKAGIAQLWFVTLHPFEDSNGRIARAIADMALARSEQSTQRFYSMSAQIRQERKTYGRFKYEVQHLI